MAVRLTLKTAMGDFPSHTLLNFLDVQRWESGGSIIPHSSENRRRLPPNLMPLVRGNSLPAHGNAVGKWSQKITPCKGTLACPVHSKSWRHHGAPLQGLRFHNGSNPWRCHGLRVACPFRAETLRLFRILQKTSGACHGLRVACPL